MNAIFQYLVLHDFIDEERDPIDGVPRSEVYKQITEQSTKSFKWYADQVGADHVFTDTWWFDKPHLVELNDMDNHRLVRAQVFFEILRVIYDEQFDKYDKVLIADIDVIANSKENIFEVSDADFYGVFETDITDFAGNFNYNPWDQKTIRGAKQLQMMVDFHEKFDYPYHFVLPPNNPSRFMNMNTGLFVMSKKARLTAREKFGDWKVWVKNNLKLKNPLWFYVDQFFICAEVMKHNIEYEGISQKWNIAISNYGNDALALQRGNFLHYSGGKGRSKLFKHLEEKRFIWS